MGNTKGKLAFCVSLAVADILRHSDGVPIFATFTFHENLTEKEEAQARWRKLKERIRRVWPHLIGVGVWQRQKRGAWHLHYVFNRYLPIGHLREMALQCGFGPMLNLHLIERHSSSNVTWSHRRVIQYLTRYVTRTFDETDSGVRVVDYHGPHARLATVRFNWARGFGQLYRKGRQMWSELFASDFGVPKWDQYWFIIRLGWEAMTTQEQERILCESDAVCKWWNPEAHPF